jgi:Mg2+/Co2+ transporter CorB
MLKLSPDSPVELAHKEGGVHRDMLGGIPDLRELSIGDVAIHRKNMVAIDADTRVPAWRGTPDNIMGVLRTKDVMRGLARRRGQFGVGTFFR